MKTWGSLGDLNKVTQVHYEIVRRGFVKKNVMLGNALVDMYVNCGMLEKAQKVHGEPLVRTPYSLNHSLLGMLKVRVSHQIQSHIFGSSRLLETLDLV